MGCICPINRYPTSTYTTNQAGEIWSTAWSFYSAIYIHKSNAI